MMVKNWLQKFFRTGDFLGYVAMLEGTVYKDSAEALEETELAIIPKEDFDRLVNNNKEVAQKFIRLLAKNISERENQLVNIAYNSLRKKVADALLMLYKKYQPKQKIPINDYQPRKPCNDSRYS